MLEMNVDEGLSKLNDAMGQFGFHKALDRSKSSRELKQLHGVRYEDPNGNVVDVDFALRVGGQGSGIMIEVSFNTERTRVWDSFAELIKGLPVTVGEWLEGSSRGTDPGPLASTVVVPSGPAPRPRVSVRAIVADLKSGVGDSEIMEKFGISHRGLLSLISKLLWDGLMTPNELAKRKSLARTVFMPVLQCRLCKEIQFEKVTQCPRCGGPMKVVNKRDSGTDNA
jgi:hypothetical protein